MTFKEVVNSLLFNYPRPVTVLPTCLSVVDKFCEIYNKPVPKLHYRTDGLRLHIIAPLPKDFLDPPLFMVNVDNML